MLSPDCSAAGSPRATMMVADSAVILKRFYFLERTLVILQAGWLPGVEHWETKLILPRVLWENSIFVRELRQRILELRFPERRLDADEDAGIVRFIRQCGDAPNPLAFVHAVAEAIRPFTLKLYRAYRERADALADAPTVFFLDHALSYLEVHANRLRAAAAGYAECYPEHLPEAERWTGCVRNAVASIPADALFRTDPPCPTDAALATGGRPFSIRRTGARDRRFHVCAFAWPDRHTPGNPGEGRRLQIRQAVHHINEVWAAEMAAACLFDLADDAPAEFLDDAARWCFDEIRHCRMGYERLKAWGFEENEIPLDAFSYDAGRALDSITRLGIIFFFESTYIHTKPERVKLFGALGDRLSSHDMDFDWADELIHAHYGKKWLEHFLRREGRGRTVAEIKREAEAAVLRRQAGATGRDREVARQIYEHLTAKSISDDRN